MNAPHAESTSAIDLAAFLVELVVLAALAVAGVRLGAGAMAIVLGVLLPVAVAVPWGMFLAPRADRRLQHPSRLLAKLVVVLAASLLLAISGAPVWAGCLLVVAGAVFAAGELSGRAVRSRQ